ncbi:MAG: hypothetical protein M0C28_33515 [Candidatus Moduliflexus flocculans]|nr:hypothetical protein [Candidatus Moduliflexus flocculans]
MDTLRAAYDFIILDIGRSLSRISLPLIQQADLIRPDRFHRPEHCPADQDGLEVPAVPGHRHIKKSMPS